MFLFYILNRININYKTMWRYFGIHRPQGFHFNQFIVFYTKDPLSYTRGVVNTMRRINESDKIHYLEPHHIVLDDPVLVFSNKSYSNYKHIHNVLCAHLDENSYFEQKALQKWPVITINNNILELHDTLDDVIEYAIRKSNE